MKYYSLIPLCGLIIILFFFTGCGSESVEDNPENTVAMSEQPLVYFGTYTRKESHVDGKGSGVYRGRYNPATGKLSLQDSVTDNVVNPSFVAWSRDEKFLYAVSETNDGELIAYRVGKDGRLTEHSRNTTGAGAPCHIAVDASDRLIVTSNYSGGNVNVFYRDEADKIYEVQRIAFNREEGERPSHAHSATFSPDNRYVFVADLGKDKIWGFRIDEAGLKDFMDRDAEEKQRALNVHAVLVEPEDHWAHPDAETTHPGPRHFAFHPDGAHAYVINELNSTVTAFDYDAENGTLTAMQSLPTLPEDFTEWNACADIHVHPNGRFLFGSNRGHNSIVTYAIGADGRLSVLGHTSTGGEFPRNFALSPDGRFLYAANQNTDNILQLAIDTATGDLTRVEEIRVMTPVCVAFANH